MPIFLCKSSPRNFVESFIDAVKCLATQSKAQMKLKFLEVETAIKSKLTRTLESLNERRCRNQRVFEIEDHCFEDDGEDKDASEQFLQTRKNQLIELQEHLERYCNVLPVFGFNSAKHDINLINYYLLPILNNEANMLPTVIEKKQALTRVSKIIIHQKLKVSFANEWFDCPEKMNNCELP